MNGKNVHLSLEELGNRNLPSGTNSSAQMHAFAETSLAVDHLSAQAQVRVLEVMDVPEGSISLEEHTPAGAEMRWPLPGEEVEKVEVKQAKARFEYEQETGILTVEIGQTPEGQRLTITADHAESIVILDRIIQPGVDGLVETLHMHIPEGVTRVTMTITSNISGTHAPVTESFDPREGDYEGDALVETWLTTETKREKEEKDAPENPEPREPREAPETEVLEAPEPKEAREKSEPLEGGEGEGEKEKQLDGKPDGMKDGKPDGDLDGKLDSSGQRKEAPDEGSRNGEDLPYAEMLDDDLVVHNVYVDTDLPFAEEIPADQPIRLTERYEDRDRIALGASDTHDDLERLLAASVLLPGVFVDRVGRKKTF